MTPRKLASTLFGAARVEPLAADLALTLLRVFAGLALASHGRGKLPPSEKFVAGVADLGFPAPTFFAWNAGLAELAGGLLVALGLATRPAAAFAAFTMAVAAFGRHWNDPFDQKEKALLFLTIMLAFVVVGSGRFALDRFIRAYFFSSSPNAKA